MFKVRRDSICMYNVGMLAQHGARYIYVRWSQVPTLHYTNPCLIYDIIFAVESQFQIRSFSIPILYTSSLQNWVPGDGDRYRRSR